MTLLSPPPGEKSSTPLEGADKRKLRAALPWHLIGLPPELKK